MVSKIVSKLIPFKLYALMALFVGVLGLGGYMIYKIKTLENQVLKKDIELNKNMFVLQETGTALNAALITNQSNAAAFKKLELEYKDSIKILVAQHKEELKRKTIFTKIKEKITHDKKINDAPAATVLVNNTNSLWQQIKNSRSSKDCRESDDCKTKDTR